jgi:hypothetical protein
MRMVRAVQCALLSLGIVACGGRVLEGTPTIDGGPALDGASLAECPACPDPATVYPRGWCMAGAHGLPDGCACPSANAAPTCGALYACTCADGLWDCLSPTLPGCDAVCPPPSEVMPLGECSSPTDLLCPSVQTYDGYPCSCNCGGDGMYNCAAYGTYDGHTC